MIGSFDGFPELPMSQIYRLLTSVSWALGVLSLIAAVVFRLVPTLSARTTFTTRGGIILAGTLFLCALASAEMRRMATASEPASEK